MESDLQITIKGVQEELAKKIGYAVADAIKAFKQVNEDLDIQRMHRILLPADFAGELNELSRKTASGNPITHTNEEYAIAVAKVLILPRDEEYEIVLVINANVAAALAPENKEDRNSHEFRTVLHLLHHELCHIHDNNKQIDAFNGIMLRHRYVGKDIYIRPLSEVCWSEYIANFLSSPTANNEWISIMAGTLADTIERTKKQMDEEILEYRYHGDLDKLLSLFQTHGGFLLKTAAYNFGYVDGLNMSFEELSDKAFKYLSGSYFESTWNAMQSALRIMRGIYPDGWKNLSVFDGLSDVIENYWAEMGFYLSSTDDGRAYVDIFRPETTPNL